MCYVSLLEEPAASTITLVMGLDAKGGTEAFLTAGNKVELELGTLSEQESKMG